VAIFLDEKSLPSLEKFAELEELARLARENDLPLGGISVILLSDFYQLPPVSGNPLYASLEALAAAKKPSDAAMRGCKLLENALQDILWCAAAFLLRRRGSLTALSRLQSLTSATSAPPSVTPTSTPSAKRRASACSPSPASSPSSTPASLAQMLPLPLLLLATLRTVP